MEENSNNNNSLNKINIKHHSIEYMLPREVQNANSLIFSQINLNKYTWEKEGELILNKENLSKEDKRILKYLILKKMPDNQRSKLWVLASGAKREIKNSPLYYKSLTNEIPSTVPFPYKDQIEADLKRTFPEDPYFLIPSTISKMRNILLAYSRRNIAIGYCQGFNFIVGKILKAIEDEEQVFWIFTQIIEQYLPSNYYSNMAGVMVDSAIMSRLLQISIPDLNSFLINHNFELHLNNTIFNWFVKLYTDYFSENLGLIFLDVFFLDGSMTLFKIGLGILKSLKKRIMQKTSIDEIYYIIENESKLILETPLLVYYLILRRFEFKIDFININRDIYEANIIETFFKISQEKDNRDKCKLIEDSKTNKIKLKDLKKNSLIMSDECCVEWPLCIYDIYYKNQITDYFIFRSYSQPSIFENYFFSLTENELQSNISLLGSVKKINSFKKKKKYPKGKLYDDQEKIDEENSKINTLKNLLIARRPHFCQLFNSEKEEFINDEELDINYMLRSPKINTKRRFTAINSFLYKLDNEKDKKSLFGNFISDLRNTTKIISGEMFDDVKPFKHYDSDEHEDKNFYLKLKNTN